MMTAEEWDKRDKDTIEKEDIMNTYAVVMQPWSLFNKEKLPQFTEFVCANSVEEVQEKMYKKYSYGWLDGGAYPIAIYELVWEEIKNGVNPIPKEDN